MSNSLWFDEHKATLRRVILAVFLIAMLGPWMFDRIFVPAEYTCDLPNVRLHGDFCGMPISGVRLFELFVGGFFYMLIEMTKGMVAGRSRELLIGLLILPLIPFLTTLLLIWKKETRRVRTINLVAWILALFPTLTLFIIQIRDKAILLWGLWLYILVAINAVIFEIALLRSKNDVT